MNHNNSHVKRLLSMVVAFAMLLSLTGTALAIEPTDLDSPDVAIETETVWDGDPVDATEEDPALLPEDEAEESETETPTIVETTDNLEADDLETAEEAETEDQTATDVETEETVNPEDQITDVETEVTEPIPADPENVAETLIEPEITEAIDLDAQIENGVEAPIPDDVWAGTPVITDEAAAMLADDYVGVYADPTPYVTNVPPPTSYQEVYDRIMVFRDIYPEGLTWTNEIPYGSSNVLGDAYTWHGGLIKNIKKGVGCAGFVFIASDGGFGDLPATVFDAGDFTFDDVRVGDILRIYNNSHFVIVLQKSNDAVIVAEANYNRSVHWGRALSKAEVMAANFLVTRYPAGFVSADAEGADDIVDNGKVGSLDWSLTKAGTLTISGNGPIPDYDPNDNNLPPWDGLNVRKVVIESGVTAIGANAFRQSTALSVFVPEGITSIGQGAFYRSSLLAISIPGTVKTIHDDAFAYCTSITSITISEGVTTIGERAFQGCTSFAYVDFPASVTSVGGGAFTSCEKLTRVRFMPGNAKVALGDNLFAACWNLYDVTLPQSLTAISAGMFQSCRSLQAIYIPASVTDVGEHAFTNCLCLSYGGVYYGSTEQAWNDSWGSGAIASLENELKQYGDIKVPVYFEVPFEDPFEKDPNDPGDLIPEDPEEPTPSEHKHAWTTTWSNDETHHWHECEAADCPVSNSSDKDGYGEHTFVDDVCTDCGYKRASTPSNPDDNKPTEPSNPGGNKPVDPSNPDDNKPVDPENPGDNQPTDPSDPGGNKPVEPENPDTPGGNEPSEPGNPDTPVTPPPGEHEHVYGNWVIDANATASQSGTRHRDCTVCGYRQTESIPATGGSSGGSSGSNRPSGGSSSSGGSSRPSSSTTTRNPAGVTTSTAVDSATGAKTETIKQADGSSVATTTQKDGTVTIVATDTTGSTTTTVKLASMAIDAARQNQGAVNLPIAKAPVASSTDAADTITIQTQRAQAILVAIPVEAPTASTVAVQVNPDGTTEILKQSIVGSNRVVVPLRDGATIKLIDNQKYFTDAVDAAWAEEAITFVSARGLFAGVTETSFAPNHPMTRAMLMTVLARLDGVDTSGGTTSYTKGIEWAVANGISNGTNPSANITREQLLTMLWRYAGAPTAKSDTLAFTDASTVNGYAEEAMRWAVENGILGGFSDAASDPNNQRLVRKLHKSSSTLSKLLS